MVDSVIPRDRRNRLAAVSSTAGLLEADPGEDPPGPEEVRDQAQVMQGNALEAVDLLDETRTIAGTVTGEADSRAASGSRTMAPACRTRGGWMSSTTASGRPRAAACPWQGAWSRAWAARSRRTPTPQAPWSGSACRGDPG
ncbi:hypothetical protein BRD56_07570 [Thermoplasmatales archaeon SW_10_69_26]|nr:MAG: hypothetical protein BRD56_07570 [Thermoplasmatales archaeon SW_10_69_26]